MKPSKRLARLRGSKVAEMIKVGVILMNLSTAILCIHIIYTLTQHN